MLNTTQASFKTVSRCGIPDTTYYFPHLIFPAVTDLNVKVQHFGQVSVRSALSLDPKGEIERDTGGHYS